MGATDFITIRNGIITGLHNGDSSLDHFQYLYSGHEIIEISSAAASHILVGDPTSYYTDAWDRKSDKQLIAENLMTLPQNYKLDGDYARKMTDTELIIAGLKEPEAGTKVENGEIVDMTLEELLKAELITQDQYLTSKTAQATAELNKRLSALNTVEAQAQAMIDSDFATELKAKLAALLAVKKQDSWPISVVWPE